MNKFKELSIGLMCLFIGIVFLCGALEILTIIDKIEQRSLQQARVEEAGRRDQIEGRRAVESLKVLTGLHTKARFHPFEKVSTFEKV